MRLMSRRSKDGINDDGTMSKIRKEEEDKTRTEIKVTKGKCGKTIRCMM